MELPDFDSDNASVEGLFDKEPGADINNLLLCSRCRCPFGSPAKTMQPYDLKPWPHLLFVVSIPILSASK